MTRSKSVILFILLDLMALPSFCFPEEALVYDKIVVTSRKQPPSLDSLINNYSPEVIPAFDIEQKSFNTLVDLLDDVAGLDLRYRGTSGIQGDLSVRGSTFEQVAVSIDGIPVNDPQTGHHNLDIPLTSFDIERIEIVKEGASSWLNKNALAGSVNFQTKKPRKKALRVQTIFGEHALWGDAFSLSVPGEELSGRFSFEHKVSKAARPNTDFEYKTGSLYLVRDFQDAAADVLLGYQEKDFGADSFYSNLFPEEEEHTRTLFVRTGWQKWGGLGFSKTNVYLRKHRDKFILSRNDPAYVNYHTTYAYGLASEGSVSTEKGDLTLGLETGRDQINSTNLGQHTRQHVASSFGLIPRLCDNVTMDMRVGFHGYQKWAFQESYNFGVGYLLIDEKLRINGSLGRAFRIPTFTELYYSDAANKGNSDLSVEKSDHFRLGLDFRDKTLSCALEGFLRQGRNLIDWTRASETEAWKATNLGRVDFRGLEATFRLEPAWDSRGTKLERITFSYTYIDTDRKEAGFLSKYALDVLRHQLVLGIDSEIFGICINWQLSYNERCFGETYFVGDLVISKRLISKDFIFEPFLKIDNFSNTRYTEVGGVLLPGRWVQGGIRLEW
ncbi:MAG: TonB-dependent receptor [Candidatus Omnitrophota bacterium]